LLRNGSVVLFGLGFRFLRARSAVEATKIPQFPGGSRCVLDLGNVALRRARADHGRRTLGKLLDRGGFMLPSFDSVLGSALSGQFMPFSFY
jgi:hypothetical protein